MAYLTSARSNCRRRVKRNDDALASYDRALAIKPDYAEALNNKGNLLIRRDRWQEAEDVCRKAAVLRPEDPNAWNNLGFALNGLYRWDEAEYACRKAVI